MKAVLSVSIEQELIDQLKVFAKENRSNVSNVVDNAVWAFLNPAPTVIRKDQPKKTKA